MAPAAGELLHYPRTRTLPSLKYVSLLVFSCIAVILPCPSASSSPSYYGAPKIAPPISHTQSGSNVKADQQEGQVSAGGDTGAGSASTVVIDADEIIDEMAAASRGSDGGGSATEEGGEGVYKSTQVYRQPQSSTSTPQQLIARGRRAKRRSKSHLQREGDSLLKSFGKLTFRTTHGVCRAVNVTGTAASVVTGGVFKLAGAAVLDAVDGLEYVTAKSPTEVPGISEAYRFMTSGLRKTGNTVYDFGVAAENVTAEATEAAEETIRNVVETVIETASGSSTAYRDNAGNPLEGGPTRDYFSEQEDRIIDHMMFGEQAPDGGEESTGSAAAGAGTGGGTDVMAFSDGDLSTQFGRDAVRGHHQRYGGTGGGGRDDQEWESKGRGEGGRQQHHHQQQIASGSASSSHGDPLRLERDRQQQQQQPRPKMLALAARARLAIRRSIMRTSKAVPSMRVPQMMACGMVFVCRSVFKSPWIGAASFVGARMYLKFVEAIYLECLKERMMSDIKFEAVARLHEGSPERARWFNSAAEAMWVPMLEPLLAGWASRQISRGIERSLPSNVSWVGLGKVTLGPTPPKIRYVLVQNVTSLAARKSMGQSNSVIDSVLLEAGQPGEEVVGENVVYLELGVDWTSYRSKVSLKLGEQSRRRNWWSVSSYVPSYRVKVCDLSIKAKVLVALAIGEGRPFVKRVWVGFAEPPLTHLSLEALTGVDVANMPVLRKHLRHVVMRCLMPLTEPRHLSIDVKPPPHPPGPRRGAALAARVGPAAAGVKKGILTRVPGFGIRHLMRNRGDAVSPLAETEGNMDGSGLRGPNGSESRNDLEEATKRLLAEVGRGDYREEIAAAAAVAVETEVENGEEAPPVEAAAVAAPAEVAVEKMYEATMSLTAEDGKGQAQAREYRPDGDIVDGGEGEGEDQDRRKATVAAAAMVVDGKKEGKGEEEGGEGEEEKEEEGKEEEGRNEDGVGAKAKVSWWMGRRERLSLADEEHAEKDPPEELLSSEEPSGDAAVHITGRADTASVGEDAPAATTVRPSTFTPTTSTTKVVTGRCDKRKEVRERRAKIKRRRAARREQQGALAPTERGGVTTLLRPLRRFWGNGRSDSQNSMVASPEREDMIRRVCALSRPPPCEAPCER